MPTNPTPAAVKAATLIRLAMEPPDRYRSVVENAIIEKDLATIIDAALEEERRAGDAMDNVLFALTVAAGTNEVLWNEAREVIRAYRAARGMQ